jgi:hypothetical protein
MRRLSGAGAALTLAAVLGCSSGQPVQFSEPGPEAKSVVLSVEGMT